MRKLVLTLVAVLAFFTFIRDFSAESGTQPEAAKAEMSQISLP